VCYSEVGKDHGTADTGGKNYLSYKIFHKIGSFLGHQNVIGTWDCFHCVGIFGKVTKK